MYNVGDAVMYGAYGICRISALEKRNFTGEDKEYYILKHIGPDKNTFYVPADSEEVLSSIRCVCTKAEADALIAHMNCEGLIWIENDSKRKEEYKRIIRDGDKKEMIRLIKTLYLRRKELSIEKKKLRSFDEQYLSIAENMLFEEFAYALDIDRSEVVDYIEEHIA